MRVLWFNKNESAQRLDEIERQAASVHKKNITKIKQTKQKVDTLNIALRQNNIVFQLAHVIGHTK